MFSKNLMYYRLMNSMSKKELAQKVNVSSMAISNYESGTRMPDMTILRRLAEVLHVKISDFLAIRNENIVFHHNEFRKVSTLSKSKQEYVFACAEEYFSRFMTTVEILGGEVLPVAPQCYTLPLTMNAEEDAQNLRRFLGFALDGPIEDIMGKLENKGILIFSHEVDDEFSGVNGFVNDRPYIMVNAKMSPERNRSTMIHELAHLMFKWDEPNLTESDMEKHATAISGAFLFPRIDVVRELGIRRKCISGDMKLVAKEYGISMMMLATRAKNAKIISESAAKSFYMKASQLGWRKNEPSRILPEQPLLFKQLVYRAINEHEINIQRGVELLQIPYEVVVANCRNYEG